MTKEQKQSNTNFFNKVISITKEGGQYIWPDEKENYTVKGGKFIAKKHAINKIKRITTNSFHLKLINK